MHCVKDSEHGGLPPTQPQDTGISPSRSQPRTQTNSIRESQIVGKWPFPNHAKEMGSNETHLPSTLTARNGRISRLGPAQARTFPTPKSQIVGKWPFLNRKEEMRLNEVYPLEAPARGIRAYLPVGAGPNAGHSDIQNSNRWNSAILVSSEEFGAQGNMPPPGPNLEKTGVSPGWGRPQTQTQTIRHANPKCHPHTRSGL